MAGVKKEIERYYLEKLLKEVFGESDYHIEESEHPDFLLHFDNRTIGIELIVLIQRMQKLQEQERNAIVSIAKQQAMNRNINSLSVAVYFHHKSDLRKKDRNSIANRLVDIILSNISDTESDINIEDQSWFNDKWPAQIQAISIRHPSYLKSHRWQSGCVGIVHENFEETAPRLLE